MSGFRNLLGVLFDHADPERQHKNSQSWINGLICNLTVNLTWTDISPNIMNENSKNVNVSTKLLPESIPIIVLGEGIQFDFPSGLGVKPN